MEFNNRFGTPLEQFNEYFDNVSYILNTLIEEDIFSANMRHMTIKRHKANVFEVLESLHFQGRNINNLFQRIEADFIELEKKWRQQYPVEVFGDIQDFKIDPDDFCPPLQDMAKWVELELRSLKSEIKKIERFYIENKANQSESGAAVYDAFKPATKQPNLSLKQIALIHVYYDKVIDNQNKDKIAAKHYYTAKNSGHKLYQYFNKYSKKIERTGVEITKQKTKNKIKLIKSIIEHLQPKTRKRALDELKNLNDRLETEF